MDSARKDWSDFLTDQSVSDEIVRHLSFNALIVVVVVLVICFTNCLLSKYISICD